MTVDQIYQIFFKTSKTIGRNLQGFVSTIMKDRLYRDMIVCELMQTFIWEKI